MTITTEQRTYARVAGVMILANFVLQEIGDGITIQARGGQTFAQTAGFAAGHAVLWRFSLLNVGLAWIAIGVLAFALYAVLEPVNKRLAQLAFVLRLGASFVGAASLMFRFAQARLYQALATESLFAPEQLRVLSRMIQSGANAGVWTSWIFMGLGSMLFFVLFLRSQYLPRALAWLGIIGAPLLIGATIVMFVFPEGTNWLKLFGVPGLLADVATAFWLLIKGLPRATAEAQA